MTLTPADYCRDAIGHGCFARDLDGAIQAFTPSVRDRLIERGVLTQQADTCWYLSWHGFDLDRERAADMACCDFCSARPVAWLIPCVSFLWPPAPGMAPARSEGDWAACAPCGADIDAGRKTALLQRSLAVPALQTARAIPGLAQALQQMKRAVHQRFWQHYRGGAVRIPSHPYGH